MKHDFGVGGAGGEEGGRAHGAEGRGGDSLGGEGGRERRWKGDK